MSDEPATELLHWGREEEFDDPTALFEVASGIKFWVSARDTAEALRLIKEDEQEDFMDGTSEAGSLTTVKALTLEEANELSFLMAEGESTSMASEYNRDPSPRVIACSEWEP